MDMEALLEPKRLIRLTRPELAAHFQNVASTENVDRINSCLLDLVHREAIPAAVFRIWLPIAFPLSPSLLRIALRDQISQGVRRAAILTLSQTLGRRHWERGWEAVGGASGLKEAFEILSVNEVPFLSSAIAECRKAPPAATVVDELLGLLFPSLTRPSEHLDALAGKGSRRLLWKEMAPVFQACSESFLVNFFSNPLPPSFPTRESVPRLVHWHTDLLRRVATGRVDVHSDVRKTVWQHCVSDLIIHVKPYEAVHLPSNIDPAIPPGMAFCFDLIHTFNSDKPLTKNGRSELLSYVDETIKLAVRRKAAFVDIVGLLKRGLLLYETLDDVFIKLREPLSVTLIRYWAISGFGDADIDAGLMQGAVLERRLNHPSRPKPEHHEDLEALVVQFVRRFSKQHADPGNLWRAFSRTLRYLFKEIAPLARFALLKLLCRHVATVNIDIDEFPPSERERSLVKWDAAFLSHLPSQDAKLLYERLLSIRSVEDVQSAGSLWYEEGLLKVKWEAEERTPEEGKYLTHKLLEDVKTKAQKERDPQKRLTWAKRAVDVSLSSASINIFKSVVDWSRRFLRDPNVGPALFQHISSPSTASVLSCVELPSYRWPPSMSDLRGLVETANLIISSHIQSALLALGEPFFQSRYYQNFNRLLRAVISNRIDGAKVLYRLRVASESELLKLLLEPLKPILLEYEHTALTEGRERLGWGILAGPLDGLDCPAKPSRDILTFLDDLAKHRDELWTQKRMESNFEVSTLGVGLPKGLPAQYLFPSESWSACAINDQRAAPFTAARLNNVLFCDSSSALAVVPSNTAVIGRFVDDLWFTIRSFIAQGSKEEKTAKLVYILRYYSESVLSSTEELVDFRSWLAYRVRDMGLQKAARIIDPPALPSITLIDSLSDAEGMVKWDPRNGHGSNRHMSFSGVEREREDTIIKCRLRTGRSSSASAVSGFEGPYVWIFPGDAGILSIWRPQLDIKKLPLQNGEALILSAILFLDTFTINEEQLLSKPFPQGTSQPRYLPVFLDPDFLALIDKEEDAFQSAIGVVEQLAALVPTMLVRNLASALLKSIGGLDKTSPSLPTIQEIAFRLIKLLPLTDKPELSVDLFIQVFRDLPDASSWHRQLNPLRLGRQLNSGAAGDFVKAFSEFVFDALSRQNKRRIEQEQANAKAGTGEQPILSARPFVKITTVKMLAQLLSTANFIPQTRALHLLQSLFYSSHHIDARTVVIDSISEIMQKATDSEEEEAYKLFASLASAAAVPNERVDITEKEWSDAEEGGDLPKVSAERPLLSLFTSRAFLVIPKRYREVYARDVLMPLLDESTTQHNRWMKAFLSRLQLTPDEASVTNFGPFDNDMVESILRQWVNYLPRSYLRRHRAWALSYLDCRLLQNIGKRLKAQDPFWQNTHAGKHWFYFLSGHQKSKPFGLLKNLLLADIDSVLANGITAQDLEDEYCERAGIVIRQPFEFSKTPYAKLSLKPIVGALTGLRPPKDSTQQLKLRLQRIPERIVADIESIRTDAWLANPNRSPAILPWPIHLEILLLPYPHLHPESEQRYENFIARVLSLIQKCANLPTCASDLQSVEAAMGHVENGDIIPCALLLGDEPDGDRGSISGYFRIQLAVKLLQRLKLSQRQGNVEVTAMMNKWKKSPNEFVRLLEWNEDGTPID